MGKAVSDMQESFEGNRLEYPHYTRPRESEGRAIPDVLLAAPRGDRALARRGGGADYAGAAAGFVGGSER